MQDHAVHVAPMVGPGALLVVFAVLGAAVLYVGAAVRLRARSDAWSRWRDASVVAGAACLVAAAVAPLHGGPFTTHMLEHLLVGMVGPLLLVLGRPVTLLLRTLPPGRVRRGLLAVLHSPPAGMLTVPLLAAVLDMGGLWVLYRTPLFSLMHDHSVVAALVHIHVFAAGMLFTIAVCGLEPLRRRYGLGSRALVLLAAGAVHAVLAKTLYAHSPPGTSFAATDLQTGAQWMYYGGDLVGLALAAVLAVNWYGEVGRARARATRSVRPVG